MRNMSVNAALFARETQGWAINKCDYVPVIAEFFARETQNFASLLADAIVISIFKHAVKLK